MQERARLWEYTLEIESVRVAESSLFANANKQLWRIRYVIFDAEYIWHSCASNVYMRSYTVGRHVFFGSLSLRDRFEVSSYITPSLNAS